MPLSYFGHLRQSLNWRLQRQTAGRDSTVSTWHFLHRGPVRLGS